MRITGSMSSRSLVSRTGRVRKQLGRSFERVASGKRINSGRDDAAGLVISARMKAQSVSLKRTGLNMQDGEALARVANTGLSSIADMLMRMRELAVQAANDTNTPEDRVHLQREIDQILTEIDRVSTQTEIFGQQPLTDPMATEVTNPPERVDVAFLVDNSGSMGPKINNLKLAIGNFKNRLEEVSDDVRFGLMVVGKNNDSRDAARMLADIGADDFDTQLGTTPATGVTAGPGGLMDSYYATREAVDDQISGTREPDLFSFGPDAKRLILLTDTSAVEGGRALGEPGAVPASTPPTQQDVADALEAADVQADAIANLAHKPDFDLMTGQTGGAVHDLGADGSGVATALTNIALELTTIDAKPLTDEPEIHSGIHADETIAMNLNSDSRAGTLGVSQGNGTGSVLSREEANELMTDIDDALRTINRYQGEAGAIANRLVSAQRAQAVATESTDRTVARMEAADMAMESYELARNRVRMEAANSTLTRAFSYQRQISGTLLNLIG